MKVDNCTRTNVATVVECQNYILKRGGGQAEDEKATKVIVECSAQRSASE